MKLFHRLMQKLGRRTPAPQDGYRSAWAARISALEIENERLRHKAGKWNRLALQKFLPGVTILSFLTVFLIGGTFGGVVAALWIGSQPRQRVIELDEIEIVGVVPMEVEESCAVGSYRACMSGLAGACSAGIQTCAADGRGFTACVSTSVPSSEVCNGVDDDCDGVADEEVCTCTPASTRHCSTGRVDEYAIGEQTCANDGRGWGACIPLPTLP